MIGDIHKRIGEEIPRRSIRTQLENLISDNTIKKEGTKYFIDGNL